MKIVRLDIKNFRGIRSLSMPLDDMTVLVGENNSGKSSILDALRLCLKRSLTRKGSQFDEYDYHLANPSTEPTSAPPIQITLYFKERTADEWPDTVLQSLDPASQVDPDDLNAVTLQVSAHYDSESKSFVSGWTFLDGAGNPMTGARNPRLPLALQRLVPLFYLGALRDAAQEFRPRSQFWGPFLKAAKLDETTKKELEEALAQLNQRVLDSHNAFESVMDRLKDATDLVPLAAEDSVDIQAIPGRVFDLLSKTQVMLASSTGTKLPLDRHGEGTQSLAVIFLFDAFLRTQLAQHFDAGADPLLAMEEPEAHLHPSAIRELARKLQELDGQKILTTHSGELLAGVPLSSIRRLARDDGEIRVHQLRSDTLSPKEIQKVTFHIRSERGRLLFARCWLLVEGESEFTLLPELANHLGLSLDTSGVCCVTYRQWDIAPLLRLADDLGILWHAILDNDQQGADDEEKINEVLGDRDANRHITRLPEQDLEHCLWNNGYHDIFESAVTPVRRSAMVNANPDDEDYPGQVIRAAIKSTSKPFLAALACSRISEFGVPVPLESAIHAAQLLVADGGT